LLEQFDTTVTSTALYPTVLTNGREVASNVDTQFNKNGYIFQTLSCTGLKIECLATTVRAKFPFSN